LYTKKIVIADDQHINAEVLKIHLDELGVPEEQCTYLCDGQATINYVIKHVEDAIVDFPEDSGEVNPIALLILDFQMPFKNGIQVVQELRAFYQNTTDELERTIPDLTLKEPKIVFLTAHASPIFKGHLKEL
jgi:CheY-like chemotaxis protein